VSIRRLLGITFLLASLVPAAVLTVLAFISSRNALLTEITHGLELAAGAVSSEIDKQMFERLLNATTWNHLEVMEDLRLDDVDKRLSRFLSETREHYGGIYRDLHATDLAGRVLASSNPTRIGQQLDDAPAWMTVGIHGEQVTLHPPVIGAANPALVLRSRIPSLFTADEIGLLVLEVDWQQLEQVLDRSSTSTRQILVLGPRGHVVAASWALRASGISPGDDGSRWQPASPQGWLEYRDDAGVFDGPAIIGYGRSAGSQTFSGLGWTFVLLQSRTDAVAPIQRMFWLFAGMMATTAIVVVLLSLWIAGVISRPITALTEFTRRFMQPGAIAEPPADGPGEVGELTRSFTRMVADLQQSQRTLTQASKLAAVGEVTALLAHEVRTPLGILRSSAQMLRADESVGTENRELLQIILTETERLNRLVASMLDSARTRAPERVPTDLHGLIAHTNMLVAAQARDRGVEIAVQPQADDAVVDCDPEQITQVLLNLLMNALQILARGGHVQISTRDSAGRVVVEIADDGPGIPAELRSQIFDPFVFKREGGLGLGLAVVRTIVRSHGGEIAADASPLGGALFRFSLPRTAATRTPS
jgi:two-component system sensor histidine kinase HydH